MRIVEDFVDDYKLKKYGKLAAKLNTSSEFLTGRRSSDGIKIEKLLVAADGDFLEYQQLIKDELNRYHETDFLDFSLLMGKFFGVYNLYNYVDITQDNRRKLNNNPKVSRQKTLELIKKNCLDIYDYLFEKFLLSKEEFINLVGSLFEVRNDNSLYNDEVVREIAYILMGNYLFLEEHSLKNHFPGSAFCVQYFKRHNKDDKKIRVI